MFKKLITSKSLRSRTAWVITAVLILPFILFFSYSGRSPQGGPGGAAGVLFGRRVPWDQFDEQRRWVQIQWRMQFGEVPATLEPMLDGYTWDRLLLIEAAKRERIRVEDSELAGVIQGIPALQDRGRFIPERYYQFLAAMGISPASFERMVRQDLAAERLTERVKAKVQLSDADLERAFHEAEDQRRIALLLWTPDAFEPAEASLTEADIQAHYQAHPEPITQPGTVTIETIGLTREAAAKEVAVTDEQLQQHYDAHQEDFAADGKTPPLEAVKDTVRQAVVQQAVKRKLTGLAVDLDAARAAHTGFEEIAKSLGLAVERHGPLAENNLFATAEMDPRVLQAAFALTTPGQVSDVVENDDGVTLIRLAERKPPRVPPLEEVRAAVVSDLRRARGREAARAAAEQARKELADRLAAGTSFDDAAKALNLAPRSPAPFKKSQPIDGVGQAPELSSAVSAAAPRQLTPVMTAGDAFAAAYVREVLPADAAGLTAERKTQLRSEAMTQREQAALTAWLEELRKQAKLQSFVQRPETATGSGS